MLKLKMKADKEKWFDYDEDIAFLIRPFPLSERAILPRINNIYELMYKEAEYCLVDWKGIIDDDDKPVKCIDKNKAFLLNFCSDYVKFITDKSSELVESLSESTSKKT